MHHHCCNASLQRLTNFFDLGIISPCLVRCGQDFRQLPFAVDKETPLMTLSSSEDRRMHSCATLRSCGFDAFEMLAASSWILEEAPIMDFAFPCKDSIDVTFPSCRALQPEMIAPGEIEELHNVAGHAQSLKAGHGEA